MKNILVLITIILFLVIGCDNKKEINNEPLETVTNSDSRKIEVIEHMNSGGYTYIKANENGKEVWVAIREAPVTIGEILYFQSAMEMKNFESKTLNKTFASIWFIDNVSKSADSKSESKSKAPGMIATSRDNKSESNEKINVTPLKDGLTIGEIMREKKNLEGKTVKVKGKVTKYNENILQRNWIHIKDNANSDITVTTNQETKIGDIITVEGVVALNKDFGAGYYYEIIIEEAKIAIEN